MDREKEAWAELQRSQLGRGVKWLMPIVFLVLIFAVFVSDLWNPFGPRDASRVFMERSRALQPEASWFEKGWAWNRENLADIEIFENQIADESILRKTVPYYQWFFVQVLGTSGTGRVLIGREDWYFLKEAVETTMGWGAPENLSEADATVRRLAGILRSRGVELVVVPIPGKVEISPGNFSRRFDPDQILSPLSQREKVYRNWEALPGVSVLPTREILSELKEGGASSFLERDTHWTPEAMEAVTLQIAKSVLGEAGLIQSEDSAQTVSGKGDLVEMMQLPRPVAPLQTIEVTPRVETVEGEKLGEVVYLGDSFSAIYSDAVLGWGTDSGLVDLLPSYLGQSVDFRLNYGDPIEGPGQQLERLLRSGGEDSALKVVVWQFAERFLDEGDWNGLFHSN